ncbi:2-dehydropantoate 2-reductase [Pseudaquabacterium pictum]|uniref:2-dehydropantoate 2-reductase n=1 Tax=Pseudaquabacterium pictum TaxID=2315236 RepID=A0A480AYD2_9BURK|nr:2-dehydropantoate 2-reductase [Rubrivivax pictus]GCL65127.1 2-dehydropantoate 2-reductase [Rubrivivax pictus]
MAAPASPSVPPAPAGPAPTVLVMGAGSIGGWLGGRLQAAGAVVHFVGRPRMLQALQAQGLTLTDRDGGQWQLPAARLQLHPAVPEGLRPDLVLLCVKSGATAAAAAELIAALPAGTLVLSMQNGISNVDTAEAAAPGLTWLRGMVPYNVAELGPGQLHRGTDGQLAVQAHPGLAPWLDWFDTAGLTLALHEDMLPVQWGKLLLNLNNAVNALSGLPLRQQLLNADLRQCTAALISETLYLLKQAGIRPARLGAVRPGLLPVVLRLPTPLFRLLARRMLRIDDKARSSMADDLARNRPTEIDAIQGEVLRLATRLNLLAPCNARISQLVRAWSPRSQPMGGRSLRKFLNL